MKKLVALFTLALALILSPVLLADDTVTVIFSDTHLCCGGCYRGAENAAKSSGAQVSSSKAQKSVKLQGSPEQVQKALDALAAAGFAGKTNHKTLKQKSLAEKYKGKTVERLEVTGAHICCGRCLKSINAVLESVDGVEAHTAKNKAKSFVIEGKFDVGVVLNALAAKGFAVTPK